MKKLIACLFGLILSMPAMAGTCNLLNTPAVDTNATWDAQTGTVTNTKTDTRFPLVYAIQLVSSAANGSGPAANGTATSFSGPITYTKTFTTSSDTHWLRFYTSGKDTNIATLAFPCEPNTTYTFSMNVVSVDPTTVGGVVYTHMQLEKGTIATEYKPYDPNCNPCPAGQVLQTYTSATGTVTQNGTPTHNNPIYPTFYTQGNMTLRKVGDVADSYDATTGKITRRVGVKVLNGTETITYSDGRYTFFGATNAWGAVRYGQIMASHSQGVTTNVGTVPDTVFFGSDLNWNSNVGLTVEQFKQWLGAQKTAGTPVIIWYQLATETTEDWAAEQCSSPIKIATVKYNNAAFSDVVTGLNTAISTIKDVVANTINQTAAVAALQSGKQTKPADAACPAGKKCLLVEDSNGTPHWYEIVESYYNPTLPAGYTELAYLESTGTQYIDPDVDVTSQYSFVIKFASTSGNSWQTPYGIYVNNGSSFGNIFNTDNDKFYIYSGNSDTLSYNFSQNIDYTFDYDGVNKVFKINDSYTYDFSGLHGFSGTAHPYLLRLANFSSNYYLIGKLYSFKLKNADGTLVRDMIPARRESDGVLGMYDLANGQFYTNAGTGTFTAGPVVLPAGYTTLQYIQSSGAQYIDTGFITNQNTSVEMQAQLSSSTNARFFASYGANSSTPYYGVGFSTTGKWVNQTKSSNQVTSVSSDSNVHTIYKNKYKLFLDGTQIDDTGSGDFTSTNSLYLLAAHIGEATNFLSPGKLYYAKIWDDNTLVRNFVPAQQGNTVGMYDTVNGVFYSSSSSTAFTAGPVAQ